MGWRYRTGKLFQQLKEAALRRSLPGTRYFPAGRVYPYDIKRVFSSRDFSPGTIVDVGANIGQTCLYLRKWFPAAHIFSLEPVHATFERLVVNTRRFPNIRCRNIALGETAGTRTMHLMCNSELNTLMQESALKGDVSGECEQIRLATLDEFCVSEGIGRIDLLKMDAQGYELNILEGAGKTLDKVEFLLTEVGLQDTRADEIPFGRMQDYLRRHDFLFCGLYEQFRYGDSKILVGFANALYVNRGVIG